MAKEQQFMVFGLGTFGSQVCRSLYEKGAQIIAVDRNPELVDRIKEEVTQSVHLDSTDQESLDELNLDDCDVAIVAIGDNIEASILTTALLHKAGVPYIISRAINRIHGDVLSQVGANEVVNIDVDEGKRIAQRLIAPQVLDRVELSKNISMAEVHAHRSYWGQSLVKLDLRRNSKVNIVAVRRTVRSVDEMGNPRHNEEIIFPDANTVLKESDDIIVVGTNDAIDAFERL